MHFKYFEDLFFYEKMETKVNVKVLFGQTMAQVFARCSVEDKSLNSEKQSFKEFH
jgi:hypothetical protein